jgi:hypothetical protein
LTGAATPARIGRAARAAAVDYTGVTFTSPFVHAFNNADIRADFTDPTGDIAPFVMFDTGAGTPTEIIIDPTGDQLVPKPADPPPKGANKFSGWFTAQTGGIKWDFSTRKVTDQTESGAVGTSQYGLYLYARWQPASAAPPQTPIYGGKPLCDKSRRGSR